MTITDNLPNELLFATNSQEEATEHFLDACETHISNFDEYTDEDVENVLNDGYERIGAIGSVVMLDLSNTNGYSDEGNVI